MHPTNKSDLSTIKCFLLDMDGTIYLSNQIIEGAEIFLDTLVRNEREFYFLTNNSSNRVEDYIQKLMRLGIGRFNPRVISSGTVTAKHVLTSFPGAGVALFGTKSLIRGFSEAGVLLSYQDPQVIVLGYDKTITYKKLTYLCTLVRQGLPYIATHPDLNCPTDSGPVPDIGAIIEFVAASTGRYPDQIIGKPNRFMLDYVHEVTGIVVEEMAMVGDRLYTDVAMSEHGLTSILVLSGETKATDLETSKYVPDYVFNHVGELALQIHS